MCVLISDFLRMSTLIGICDGLIKDGQVLSADCSKIGGHSVWMDNSAFITPKCRHCERLQLLVTQLYCPLENSPYHRILYIYACINRNCWNLMDSWTVCRVQMLDKSYNVKEPQRKTDDMFETDDWCDDADDWGMDDCDTIDDTAKYADNTHLANTVINGAEVNNKDTDNSGCLLDSSPDDVIEGMEDLTLTGICSDDSDQSHGVWSPEDLPQPAMDVVSYLNVKEPCENKTSCADNTVVTTDCVFVGYYLNVFDEPEQDNNDKSHVKALLSEYVRKENVNFEAMLDMEPSRKGSAAEKYEKSVARHGDAIFQKFIKGVQRCPEQCIRYQWDGMPLNMCSQKEKKVPIPVCQDCGSERVFETQLMPSLVSLLRLSTSNNTVLEFGTAIVYSCKNSCWQEEDSFKCEYVDVQSDPDQHLFK